MLSRRKSRILVVQALYAWEASEFHDASYLASFPWFEKHDETPEELVEDLYFARMMFLGTLEKIDYVDSTLTRHLQNWDRSRIAKVDLAILRMGIYSLYFMKDLAHSITIDEAVSIAKEFSSSESYRFVNGILDAARKAGG